MGREKARKPRREKPTYVEHVVDGEVWPVSLPPPILDLPRTLVPDVEHTIRELKRRGVTQPRVIPILSHRRR
jgi:hypothetical protein